MESVVLRQRHFKMLLLLKLLFDRVNKFLTTLTFTPTPVLKNDSDSGQNLFIDSNSDTNQNSRHRLTPIPASTPTPCCTEMWSLHIFSDSDSDSGYNAFIESYSDSDPSQNCRFRPNPPKAPCTDSLSAQLVFFVFLCLCNVFVAFFNAKLTCMDSNPT